VDWNRDAIGADVIANLNHPLPFPDCSFDEVRAVHVIELVHDIMQTMAEIHRIARVGGRLHLVTPHYTDSSSWRDPTHRWHLNTYSFRFWTARGLHHERHWYTRLEVREVSLHVELARLWKCLGFQWLLNRFEWLRRFWEQYLCFIIRGKQMEFTFEVVKFPVTRSSRASSYGVLPSQTRGRRLHGETPDGVLCAPKTRARKEIPAWDLPAKTIPPRGET
jgi:SAM-dependent methyltransferase